MELPAPSRVYRQIDISLIDSPISFIFWRGGVCKKQTNKKQTTPPPPNNISCSSQANKPNPFPLAATASCVRQRFLRGGIDHMFQCFVRDGFVHLWQQTTVVPRRQMYHKASSALLASPTTKPHQHRCNILPSPK